MGTKTKTRDIGLETKPWIMIGTNIKIIVIKIFLIQSLIHDNL